MSESNNHNKRSKGPAGQENEETFYLNEDVDRYATIEFSADDLEQIRRPNPQPMDGDYFAANNKLDDLESNDRIKKEAKLNEQTSQMSADSFQTKENQANIGQTPVSKNSSAEEENSSQDDGFEIAIFNLKDKSTKKHIQNNDQTIAPNIDGESSSKSVKDSFSSELGQRVEIDESEPQPLYNEALDSPSGRLEDTLEIEIDEELYHRHDFQDELDAETDDDNPFAYHSIENQLRTEQSKRQSETKPKIFQRVMQTVFSPRGGQSVDDASEEEEILLTPNIETELTINQEEESEEDTLSFEKREVEAEETQETTEAEELNDVTESDPIEEIKKLETERLDTHESDGRVVAVSPSVVKEYELEAGLQDEEEVNHSLESLESEEFTAEEDSPSQPTATQEDAQPIWEKAKSTSTQTWHKVSDKTSDLWNTASHSVKDWLDSKEDKNPSPLNDEDDSAEQREKLQAESSLHLPLETPHKDEQVEGSSLEEQEEREENVSEEGQLNQTTAQENDPLVKETLTDVSHLEELDDIEEEDTVAIPDAETAEELADRVSQRTAQFSQPILTDAVLEASLGNQEDLTQDKTLEQQTGQSFVSGAAWLSGGKILSRIIGVLYIIPWATWLGTQYSSAATLYSVGYKQYALLLAIATAGFPSAVAKQMAFFNSKREFNVADKLFKYSLLIMAITGIVTSTILFIFAPGLAAISATDDPQAATLVIRTLAPALLVLPVMSLIRGYFQGFNDMIPTAISEVIEQIVRVIYILGATYVVMVIMQGSVVQAVAHSTFAAFIGAVASLVYLVIVYLRFLPKIRQLKEKSLNTLDINFKESIRLMLYDSLPFILLGSGIIVAQNIDTFTFRQIMIRTSVLLTSEISDLFGAMSLDVDKLIMIIVALAVALATSSIPAVSAKFAEGDETQTGDLVKNIFLVFTFVMLPASVGMATIANNIYPFFYPAGHSLGPSLLITGSIMSIALGAYTVLSAVLQSMNYRRQAVKYLVVGLLLKLLLQYPLVGLFHAHGAMIATTIAFLAISIFMAIKIWRMITIRDPFFIGDLIRIVIGTVVMGFGASGWNAALNLLFGPVGRALTLVKIMLVVVVAIFIYLAVMSLFGMLSLVIGDYRSDLQERFSLNK